LSGGTGPALELEVDIKQLREKMRYAFEHQEEMAILGRNAADLVRQQFTWQLTKEKMSQRLIANCEQPRRVTARNQELRRSGGVVTACIRTNNNESTIANCLSRLVPYVDEILVLDSGSTDRTVSIANEYRARVVASGDQPIEDDTVDQNVNTDWRFWIAPDEYVDENDAIEIVPFLKAQPKLSAEVSMMANRQSTEHEHNHRIEIRHFRCRKQN
jgi:hypothetical protein